MSQDGNVTRLPVKGRRSATAQTTPSGQVSKLANGRPPLKLVSTAESMKWLRNNIGAGRLAGMFRRGEEIVHCPVIGQRGYEPLTGRDRDDDGPAQVRPLDGSKIASFIQLEYCCYKIENDKSGEEYPIEVVFRPEAARLAVHFAERQSKLRSLRGVTHSPDPPCGWHDPGYSGL